MTKLDMATLLCARDRLPADRDVDSPTFVIRQHQPDGGLYPVFEQVFESQWQRGRAV